MKQYMLAVYGGDEETPSDEEIQQRYKDVDVFNAEVQAQGVWVFAGGLFPADTATVVRVTDGEVLTTDGPFAETKEQLGGFYLITARDLNDAIRVASRIPSARQGCIEVRPIREFDEQM